MKDKANSDVNTDAKNVYSFLEWRASSSAISTVYLHLAQLLLGSLIPRRHKCDIFIRAALPSGNIRQLRTVFPSIYFN